MSAPSNLVEPGTYTHAVKAILLNRILLILSFIGLFVAGALSLEMLLNVVLPCGETHGCATVAADPSSRLFGVLPVAYIGFAGYLLFAGLAIARTMNVANDKKLVQVGYGAAVLGALYSVYLQYLSFFHIHAICPYCLTSAITMILTLIVYAMLAGTVEKEIVQGGEMSRLDTWLVTGLPIALVLGLSLMASNDKAPAILAKGAKLTNPELKDLVTSDSKIFGDDSAPITVVEFADLCCPTCQKLSPKVKQFVNLHAGKVRLVFKDFPLNIHPLSRVAATIGEYAQEHGRFWDYIMDVMGLERQPDSAAEILDIAKSCGLDPNDITKRLKNSKDPLYDRVTNDLNLGHEVGVSSTPTFFIFAGSIPTVTCGPQEIMDKLDGDRYKPLLASNG